MVEKRFTLEGLSPNIMVSDVNQSIEFYRHHLGLQTIATVPESEPFDWAMMVMNKVTLILHLERIMETKYTVFQSKQIGATVVLYMHITSMKDKDIMIKESHDTFYGMKEFSIRDLDGYILTFSERIAA